MEKIPFDFEQISKLIDKISSSDISSFCIRNDNFEIKLKKEKNNVVEYIAQPTVVSESIVKNEVFASAPSKEEVIEEKEGKLLYAPIVGTFYASPSPDKEPFVEVGKRVKKGDVLYIIESMKLMNEVTSDVDGVVSEIFVEDAQGVEFGQEIMRIEN